MRENAYEIRGIIRDCSEIIKNKFIIPFKKKFTILTVDKIIKNFQNQKYSKTHLRLKSIKI